MNTASLDIKGYDGIYRISKDGTIHTVIRKGTKGNTIKHCLNRYGYAYVGLTKDGRRKNHTIHRLLALHFLDNPEGKKFVNHLDGNKQNNNLANLEWVTASENCKHAYATGLKKPARRRTL